MRLSESAPGLASGLAAALALAACASSGADNEHGPDYWIEGGRDGTAAPHDGGPSPGDSSADAPSTATDASLDAPSDALASDSPADAPDASPADGAAPAEAGAPCTSTLALLAASPTGLAEAVYGGGVWSTASLVSGGASAAPAIESLGTGYVAAFLGAGAASDAPLRWLGYAGSWSAPAAIGAAVGQGAPALTRLGATGHLLYWGSDGKFYHGTYAGSAWDGASDPVQSAGLPQSFGLSAPAAAGTGGTLLSVQAGTDGILYDQGWTSAAGWSAAVPHPGSSLVSSIPPAVVAMNGGAAELLAVVVHAGDAGSYYLQYTTRTAGVWSVPADVYDQSGDVAYASTTPALAALPGGGAVLAWLGASPAYPYVSTYTPGAGWTAPIAASGDALASPPALAAGVCGATASMAYVTSSGDVKVTRATGTLWGAPQTIAGTGAMQWVAVASLP